MPGTAGLSTSVLDPILSADGRVLAESRRSRGRTAYLYGRRYPQGPLYAALTGYYSLQYGISTDNSLVTYHDVRAIFNYDINSCLTIGAEARAFTSSVYDLYSVMGFVQIRFLGQ